MCRTHPSVCSIQILLQLAKGIFEDQSNLDVCVYNIMSESLELLDVERCMVFLIDDSCKGVSIFIEAPSPPVFVFEVSFFVNIKEEILVNSWKFSVPLFPWEGRQGSRHLDLTDNLILIWKYIYHTTLQANFVPQEAKKNFQIKIPFANDTSNLLSQKFFFPAPLRHIRIKMNLNLFEIHVQV